jgi:ABC-type Fe3+-siderophore transport system permease subunit
VSETATAPDTPPAAAGEQADLKVVPTRPLRVGVAVIVLLALVVIGAVWSVGIGSEHMTLAQIVHGLTHSTTTDDLIIRTIRLPRVVLSLFVGAALAVSGAIMQAVAGNPLAAPEIMGVNAGAVFTVVLAITVVPSWQGAPTMLLAFVGAAVAGVSVLSLAGSGRGRTSPVRLALAGVTATSLLIAVTQVLIIFHDNSSDSVLFWLVGGVNFATWADIPNIAPWVLGGLVGAMALARSLNLISLGDDMARGLGHKVERTRLFGGGIVILLSGAAVAVAGPIAFVGLIVPHILRRVVGSNYRVLLPVSALGGMALLIYADLASRYIRPPYEEPAGVVTALIGAPIFIYLARRQKAMR